MLRSTISLGRVRLRSSTVVVGSLGVLLRILLAVRGGLRRVTGVAILHQLVALGVVGLGIGAAQSALSVLVENDGRIDEQAEEGKSVGEKKRVC